jgi:flagellar hook-length control protein FliK
MAHGNRAAAVPAADTNPPAEGPGQPVSQEQIIQQVQEKLARHEVRPGGGEVRLKLHPEELGELTINLRMEDQRLRVEIVAENRTVKEALLQNLDTLRDTLSRQNISMERFDVATGGNSHQAFRDERQAQAARVPTPYGFRPAGVEDEQAAVPPASRWEGRRDALVDLRL